MKQPFYYVYILQSTNDPEHFYTGFTENLDQRVKHHNGGGDPHTAKFRPWRIKTAESYLKQGSGHAFAKRHLWS
ncbi:MAG: GIY-YIG nuclease family protein [Kiritimatiellae bacterium]|nr:GIY-YIG nuclease family protein [Kiritimatiellia bacterium]